MKRIYDDRQRCTHVEPSHTEPPNGEERVEDEEKDCGDDLRGAIVHSTENGEKDHRDALRGLRCNM